MIIKIEVEIDTNDNRDQQSIMELIEILKDFGSRETEEE
jgi:hypothetical protein|tara:strand:+ start:896 stop:1012 length:117 start_codon:yes stop_codon:yes gene_type:complete